MKKIFTFIVTALFILPVCCYAEIEFDNGALTSDPLEISVEIQKSPIPMWISTDQTDFIRNKSNGFDPNAYTNKYRRIGTTYVSWQPSDIYEILIYTDNINELGLNSRFYENQSGWTPAYKELWVSNYSGLRLKPPITGNYYDVYYIPFKVWVPRTALANQTTAPVNPDGTIDKKYIYPDNSEPKDDLCFYYVPEKMAVDSNVGTYGSYKKVIASAFDATFPHEIEVTLAMDVTNQFIGGNAIYANHKKYEGHVIFDLVGN